MLRLSLSFICAATLFATGAPATANANLVQNGSFELGPAFTGTSVVTSSDGTAAGTLPHWLVTANASINVEIYNASVAVASDGNRFVELVGNAGETIGRMNQTVSGLVVGESYTLSFDYAGIPGGADPLRALNLLPLGYSIVSASQSFTAYGSGNVNARFAFDTTGNSLNDLGWQSVSLQIEATSTQVQLRFEDDAANGPAGFGAALDNVSLTAGIVPEPASWVCMLAGFALVALRLKRRRQAQA